MSVQGDIQKVLVHLQQRTAQVLLLLVAETDYQLKARSPVLTGRFRASWTIALGAADTTTAPAVPKGATASQAAPQLPAVAFGDVVYLANALPYARRLEYGWSQQAPHGMVRITAAEAPQRLHQLVQAMGSLG